jgi:hypothetical protein
LCPSPLALDPLVFPFVLASAAETDRSRGVLGQPEWLISGDWINLQLNRPRLIKGGQSAIQLQVKTILNQVQRFVGFVYQQVRMRGGPGKPELIEIMVEPQAGIRGRCSRCRQPAPGYDRLPQRRWLFVPLWGIPTYFC